ncbi:hypothetical protein, partial [uncultured Rubinisphaera sp.]|uniref:hypothetical protein n=1 Tax=uncultured Rubinisphaera sp. TaxID=1678686 RepID=UPI0030DCEEF6
GGILELGSGGLAPDMTLEGLATSVAFGGLFSGAGFLVMPMRGVADDVTRFVDDATTGRQSSSWLNFWGDLGGETIPIRNVGDNYTGNLEWLNKLGLRQGYSTHIINDDIGGSWFAKMDTQAHEGFHAVVARHLPSVWDICDARFMSIPVGAPVKYLEEVIAYSIGHGAALRFHGIPFSPIEAFGSLTRSEGIYTAMFGLGGYGVYEYFN